MQFNRQTGIVSRWRYEARQQLCWHFTADDEGVNYPLQLLDSLSGDFTHRTIKLTQPTAEVLGVPNFSSPAIGMEKLRLQFMPGEKHKQRWQVLADSLRVTLKFVEETKAALMQAVSELPSGTVDYALEPEDSSNSAALWILWYHTARHSRIPPY